MNTQQSHNPYTNLKLNNAMLVFRGSQQLRVFSDLRKVRDLLPEEAARKMSPYMDHFIENFSHQYGGKDASMEPLWLGYPERGLWITVCPELDYGEEVGYYDDEKTLPKKEYGSYDGPTYLVEEHEGKLKTRLVRGHLTAETLLSELRFMPQAGFEDLNGFCGGSIQDFLKFDMPQHVKFDLLYQRTYLSDAEMRLFAVHCTRLMLDGHPHPQNEVLRSALDTVELYACGEGGFEAVQEAEKKIEALSRPSDPAAGDALEAALWTVQARPDWFSDNLRGDSFSWSMMWLGQVDYLLRALKDRK